MIDWDKPIQTRDGRKARVLATDLDNSSPIAVGIKCPSGNEYVYLYHRDGHSDTSGTYPFEDSDIINVPTKRKGFVYVHRIDEACVEITGPLMSEEEAREEAVNFDRELVDIVPIEWEE